MSHCNIEKRLCYPSERRLAGRIGKSERSVRSALKQLEGLGVISIERNQGRGGTNQYVLHLLERKILEFGSEGNGNEHRKISSAKQEKEKIKEKGEVGGRSVKPRAEASPKQATYQPSKLEIVTDRDCLDKWYSAIGDLNVGLAGGIMKLIKDENGYRLPFQEPGRDTESRRIAREYIMWAIRNRGGCFR